MLPVLIIAGLAALLLIGGKPLTRNDLPRIRELMLLKAGMGRRYLICVADAAERDRRIGQVATQLGIFAGIAVGALTGGNAKIGIAAARKVASTIPSLYGAGPSCESARQELIRDLKRHDELSDQLGVSREATYEQLQAIVRDLGGFKVGSQTGI